MLQYKTIEPATLQLLKNLQQLSLLQGTRLAGGTSLALQLGHRNSIDLDFFGTVPFSSEEIREILSERHALTIIKESKNINIYLIDGIKVDIVNYRYLWIDECVSEEGLVLAGIKDIAAMKIAAIIGRGTKKDFIDLHFLLRTFSLRELLDLYMNKYPDGSVFIALKSLTYFEDAEADPMPTMFEDISWMTVKANIRTAVSVLSDFRHL